MNKVLKKAAEYVLVLSFGYLAVAFGLPILDRLKHLCSCTNACEKEIKGLNAELLRRSRFIQGYQMAMAFKKVEPLDRAPSFIPDEVMKRYDKLRKTFLFEAPTSEELEIYAKDKSTSDAAPYLSEKNKK